MPGPTATRDAMFGYIQEACSSWEETKKEWIWEQNGVGGTRKRGGKRNYSWYVIYEKRINFKSM